MAREGKTMKSICFNCTRSISGEISY